MKPPSQPTLRAACAAPPDKAGSHAPGNWIGAVLEMFYQLQRRQAIQVIRAYQRFLDLPNDGRGR